MNKKLGYTTHQEERERIAIENREAITHEIHKANEAYYSVDHSPGGVSFFDYLAMHLSGAGYTRPAEPPKDKVEAMKQILCDNCPPNKSCPGVEGVCEWHDKITDEILKLIEPPVLTDNWIFLTATSDIVLPSRWRTFWNYVIKGKKPAFTISAWVNQSNKGIADLMIHQIWEKQNGHQ